MSTEQSSEFISLVASQLERMYRDRISKDDVASYLDQIHGWRVITVREAQEIQILLQRYVRSDDQPETVRNIGIYGRGIAKKLETHGKADAALFVLMGASDLLETKPLGEWALCQFQLGRLYMRLKQDCHALNAFKNAEDIFDQRQMLFELATCWRFQGQLLVKDKPSESVAKYRMAFMQFGNLGDDLSAAKCLRHIASHLLKSGELETGIELLETVKETFLLYQDIERSVAVLQRQLDYYKQMESAKDILRVEEEINRTLAVAKKRKNTPDADLVKAGNRCAELRFEEALSLYKKSEERYDRLGETERSLLAGRMVGSVLTWMDNPEDAVGHLDGLLSKESIIDVRPDLESRIWISRAAALRRDGQFYEALHSYHDAARTAGATHSQTTLAYIYENMAEILDSLGNNEEALVRYRSAFEIDDPTQGEFHQAYLQLQMGRSLTQRSEQYERGLDNFGLAQTIFDRYGLTNLQAQCLLDTAEANFNLQRLDEAADLFRRANGLGEEIGMQRIKATALRGEGSVDYGRGEHSLAERHFDQAHSVYERIERDNSFGHNLRNQAFLASRRLVEKGGVSDFQTVRWNHPVDPLSDIRESKFLAASELKVGKYLTDEQSDHYGALECFYSAQNILGEIGQTHGDLWIQLHCYLSIALSRSGEAYKGKEALTEIPNITNDSHYQRWIKQYAQGLAYYHAGQDDAVPAFIASLDAMCDFRESQLIPEFRLTFFRQYLGIFQELLSIACKLGDKHFAFRVIQEAKGRTFTDLQVNRKSDMTAEDKPVSAPLAQTPRQILVETWKHLYGMSATDEMAVQKLPIEALALQQPEFDYLTELEGHYFNREQATANTHVSITEIQSALNEGQAILDFFCLPERLVLFWTFKHHLDITTLECPKGQMSVVVDAVLSWDKADVRNLSLNQHVAVLDTQKQTGSWQRFGALLGVPILKMLKKHGIKDLFIVPHQELGSIPLHALELANEHPLELLGDHVAISYLPSASSFAQLRPYRGIDTSDGMTLFLDPDGSLPYAREESLIAQSIVSQDHLQVFVGNEANSDSFWRHWNTNRVLVLSVHGIARRHTYLSFLMLNDDLVFMHQVMEAKSSLDQTDLVILNACESGSRDRRVPDESMGMMASFLIAGAASVFSTLWRVNDLCAFLVTQEFLSAVFTDRLTPSLALQKAINAVRTMQKETILTKSSKASKALEGFPQDAVPFKHPYFWTPFVVMGRSEESDYSSC